PASAQLKLSFRLVAGQDPAKIELAVRDWLAGLVPAGIRYGFFHHPATAVLPTVVVVVSGVWVRPQLLGLEAGGYLDVLPDVDKRRVELGSPIKTLGSHQVSVRLHPEVAAKLGVEVV
ncbi:50S ribosomal L9 C-terminal domain-containing protein, partial [Streptomyces sp. SP18ES09]|uniref:50S ribosomal L9 C-terminal domain-containing protein n=1 Tax=Streptomyces sp. SP18ES09 TaxID=3002532 RepID=UPI002E761BC6